MATWESPGWTAPRSGHRVENRRSEAQDGRQKALEKRCNLAVGRHVRARKLPLELVWIKNHPDDGSTSVYCSTDEKCRLGEMLLSSVSPQVYIDLAASCFLVKH